MKHRVALVEIALAVSFSLIVASDLSAKDINLGWSGQGSWSTLPYIVEGKRGLFEKEGLRVRLITFRGTNLMLTALLAGELDYATILPFLTGASAAGWRLKFWRLSPRATPTLLSRGQRLTILKVSKGRKSASIHLAARRIMPPYAAVSRSGLDPNRDVTILPIGGGSPQPLRSTPIRAVVAAPCPGLFSDGGGGQGG